MPTRESHPGVVTDNNDPEKRGRLSVRCEEIVAGETLEWIEPSFPFVDSEGSAGWFFVPSIGSSVTVEVETGIEAQVNDLHPKWKCDLYPDGTFPEEFEDNYPKRMGLKTKGGHYFYFDDTDDNLVFLYHHPSGTEIYVNDDGQIELKPTGSQSVLVGDGADQPIPLGTLLKDLLVAMKTAHDSHKHSGVLAGAALTGIPDTLFPVVDNSILSSAHKVK